MTIKDIVQTCYACPSQWEAKTEDNKAVYIRYRWGCLSIYLDNQLIYDKTLGSEYDGVISFDKVESIIKLL